MKHFNLYYKDIKINNRPINEQELESIKRSEVISKRNNITGKIESIPVDKINIVKTIII